MSTFFTSDFKQVMCALIKLFFKKSSLQKIYRYKQNRKNANANLINKFYLLLTLIHPSLLYVRLIRSKEISNEHGD